MSINISNIESITLVLENGNIIQVECKHIGVLYLGKFERTVYGIAGHSISDHTTINKVHIEINAEVNANKIDIRCTEEQYPFERLTQWKDIAQISLKYHDGTKEFFYVNYEEDKSENNMYQKSKTNDFGDLYIVIGDGLDIDEIFPDAEINKKSRYDSVWGNLKRSRMT